MTENFRARLLAARDARAARIAALCRDLRPPRAALVVLSLNVPGPDKGRPGLDPAFASGRTALLANLQNARFADEGRDALGPWAAVAGSEAPPATKARTVALEEALPAGRLLDLDVFDADGRQIDRAALGLPPRRCFVCEEPAVECMRLQRHAPADVTSAVERLARQARAGADRQPHRASRASAPPCPPERMAAALVAAARRELDITPKPGLVDRRDNGSHPDLSYDLMTRSIDLLPRYYDDLLHLAAGRHDRDIDLDRCIAAGRDAEARMSSAIGANAHRGYIFLSGLVLLASAMHPGGERASLRRGIAALAALVLAPGRRGAVTTHGASLRAASGIGGIEREALAGLPSVFDHGLPALGNDAAASDDRNRGDRRLMATLMTVVEDTTALHRCGPAGLGRLRRDGRRLLSLLDAGDDCLAALQHLNDEYRSLGLTMGGVADCMALTLALHETLGEER